MSTRRASQVLDHPLFGRYVKHLTSCGDHHSLTLGGKARRRDVVTALFQLRARKDIIGSQRHIDLLRFLLGRIQFINVTAILKYDRLAIAAGEFTIIFCEVGHLAGLFRLGVIGEKIHRVVTVREEIDLVANPHREDVLCLVVGDVFYLLGSGIIDPNIICHTTLVVFPSTEFTHHAVVRKLFAIG